MLSRRQGARLTTTLIFLGLLAASPLPALPEAGPSDTRWVKLRDPQARAELVHPLPPRQAKAFSHKHPYRFSEDWFSQNIGLWASLLGPYMDRPGLHYLEVGVYEGRSLLWVIDNVLTQPDSRATGIDLNLRKVLSANVKLSGAADRTSLIGGASQIELRKLPLNSYDIIYIDGSHAADAVLEDVVLSWRLLKPGGLLILDDHGFSGTSGDNKPLPPELRPQLAIGAFVSAFRSHVKVVYLGYQVALVKRRGVCTQRPRRCSMLGHYAYDWERRVLRNASEKVAISAAERGVVEALIRGKKGDALTIWLARDLFESRAFASLNARLGLGLARMPESAGGAKPRSRH